MMKRTLGRLSVAVAAACLLAGAATAQEKKASKHTITTYRIAPGKHVEFLRYTAQQEAIAKEAGALPAVWYVHQDGDGWDYLSIQAEHEPAKQAEVDRKTEALTKAKGLPTGLRIGIEFRKYIVSHADTITLGPLGIDELLRQSEGRTGP